jgi:Ca-activated chloride channel family protein
MSRQRVDGGWRRLLVLVAATLIVAGLGLIYPVMARGAELGACFRHLFGAVPHLFGWGDGPDLVALSWRQPWFLLGWLVLPVVFWRATVGEDRRVPRVRLGTLQGLASGPRGFRVWLRDVPGVVRTVALGLLITALAGPLNVLRPQTTDEEGIDAVIVLDLSYSMRAVLENVPDSLQRYIQRKSKAIRPTRLDVAKAVIRDFISRRKTDRVGIVVFGKSAFVLSPTTLDYQLLDGLVAKLELELIDGRATAIGDAVGVAVARLRHSTAKSRAVVLLTDGDNNAGRIAPDYAARLANKTGVKLYTVLIGSGEWTTVQDGFDLFGNPRYRRTKDNPANPELLERLASATGGAAYVATDAAALQDSLHEVLNELEKTKFSASYASFEDLFRFLLLPGVLLLAVDALLRAFVLRRFP